VRTKGYPVQYEAGSSECNVIHCKYPNHLQYMSILRFVVVRNIISHLISI